MKKNLNYCLLTLCLCFPTIAYSQGIRPPTMITNSSPMYVAQAPAAFGTPTAPPVVTGPPVTTFDAYNTGTGYYNAPVGPGAQGQFPISPDPAYSGSPNSFYPQSNFPNGYGPQQNWPSNAYGTAKRFLQGFQFDYTWISDNSSGKLGLNQFDVNATFALPIFPNPEHPLLVTPGFGMQMWSGPNSVVFPMADLPGQTYDAYVGLAWNPMIIPGRFGAELSMRPGIYSDFSKVNSKSFRIPSRAVGVVHVSPRFKGVLGLEYIHRNYIKLLPAGGVVWTPHEKARYDILFPNPKLSHYLWTSWTNTEWWVYLSGEYGGGAWTLKRAGGGSDRVDVNDIRVMLGFEFKRTKMFDGGVLPLGQQYTGYVEIGYVFEREIRYTNFAPTKVEPKNALLIGAGLRY